MLYAGGSNQGQDNGIDGRVTASATSEEGQRHDARQ